MFLKRIHLKRFGCLHDFTAEFQPGLNVIRGPNESGKSTLHQALLMALMAQPTHNQRTQLWCNWYSDQWYELQLDFTDHAGQLYRITKDFHTNSQAIVRPNDEFVRGRDGVEKAVADTLGTNSMVIVQSTLCVEQDALAAIADGRREISQSLETVLTGSEDDIYTGQALKRLENHIKEFKKGADRLAAQPGPLAKARSEVDRLKRRAQEAKSQLEVHAGDERELSDTQSRLAQLDHELRPLYVTREQVSRYQKVQNDYHIWQQQEAELEAKMKQVESAKAMVDKATTELSYLGVMARVNDEQKRNIDQLARDVVNLREESVRNRETNLEAYYAGRADFNQHSAIDLHPEAKDTAATRYLWLGLLIGGLIAAIAGVVWIAAVNNIVAGGVLVAVGLLLMAAGVWLWPRAASLEPVTATKGDLAAPVAAARSAQSRPEPPTPLALQPDRPLYDETPLRAAEAQLQQQLKALGCQSIDELNGRYERVVELRHQQEVARSRLAGLLVNDTVEGLEARRRDASRSRRDADETLQDSALQRVAKMTPLEINKLNDLITQFEEERNQLQSKQQRLSIKQEQQLVSKEDSLQTEETLAAAIEECTRAEEHLAACELTLQVLTDARRRTLSRAQERLGPTTATYLQALTKGRYKTAWIDANLKITLQDPADQQRHIEPERLSRGARDQLYMAARLALVDLLFPRTRPPILLDDPFVHFDPERLAAAIQMCCAVAQQRQLLLFTCSNQYNHVGHQIVMRAVGE